MDVGGDGAQGSPSLGPIVSHHNQFLLFGSINTVICIDTLYTIILLHVSVFQPLSGINRILHSPSAHLLFFRAFPNIFIWE
jgi:hypothetical protein